MEKKDILESLESLQRGIENGKVELHKHHEAAIKEVVKEYHQNKSPMSAYFNLENWLYKQDDKPIEIKSAMLWGGLWVISELGAIDWNEMRNLYGEFMSKKMNLR